jgi:hypothetical protein
MTWKIAPNISIGEPASGAGGVAVLGAKRVSEDAVQDRDRRSVSEKRDAAGIAERERAQIVHAENVVGVVVCVEDGVDPGETLADGLRVEVRAGVDEDRVAVVVESNRRTCAAVL